MISRIFQIKFQQIHLISVSGHCKCFIFKMCQNVAAIRITSQFHEFLNLIFGGFSSFETFVVNSIMSPPFPFMSSNPISNVRGQILFNSWDHMLETGGVVSSGASLYAFDGKVVSNNGRYQQPTFP